MSALHGGNICFLVFLSKKKLRLQLRGNGVIQKQFFNFAG